jgi:hypothetical protein
MSHLLSAISMNSVSAHLNQSTASSTPCSCRGLVQGLGFWALPRVHVWPLAVAPLAHPWPCARSACAVVDDTSRSSGPSDRSWLTSAREGRRPCARSHAKHGADTTAASALSNG